MKNNISTGNAGEYFVAGELERHGFTVAVPMSNTKDFDILAIDRETYKQFAIQVKTTGYKQKVWTLSAKNEDLVGDSIIYFFVGLSIILSFLEEKLKLHIHQRYSMIEEV